MILGWDIGGVNTKAARLDQEGRLTLRARAFELQRDPDALVRASAVRALGRHPSAPEAAAALARALGDPDPGVRAEAARAARGRRR